MGENISEADKIGTRDKMQAMKLMLEINRMKQEAIANPDKVIDYNLQDELNDLSVDAIQHLIATSKKKKKVETDEEGNPIEEERESIIDDFRWLGQWRPL